MVQKSLRYGSFFRVGGGSTRIGRDQEANQIWLDSSVNPCLIATHHASIERRDDGKGGYSFWLHDERATSGVFVNEIRVPAGTARKLCSGDVVCFGPPRLDSEFLFRWEPVSSDGIADAVTSVTLPSKKTGFVDLTRDDAGVANATRRGRKRRRHEVLPSGSGSDIATGPCHAAGSKASPTGSKVDYARLVAEYEASEKLAQELHNIEMSRSSLPGLVIAPTPTLSVSPTLPNPADIVQAQPPEGEAAAGPATPLIRGKAEAKSEPPPALVSINPPRRRLRPHVSSSTMLAIQMADQHLLEKRRTNAASDAERNKCRQPGVAASDATAAAGSSSTARPESTATAKSASSAMLSSEQIAARLSEELIALGANRHAFECLVCMCECEPFCGLVLGCGHPICQDCLRAFGRQKIDSRELIPCPTCKSNISATDMSRIFSREDVDRYIAIEALQIRNASDAGIFNCQTPDCPNSVAVDPDDEKPPPEPPLDILRVMTNKELLRIKRIGNGTVRRIRMLFRALKPPIRDWKDLQSRGDLSRRKIDALRRAARSRMPQPPPRSDIRFRWRCGQCEASWCVHCKVPWHEGQSCLDYKLRDKFRKGEQDMQKLIKEGKLFKCECGKYIERSEGCKFMKCTCGKFFCWACKKLLRKDHQQHKCHVKGLYFQNEQQQVHGAQGPVRYAEAVADRPRRPGDEPDMLMPFIMDQMHRLRGLMGEVRRQAQRQYRYLFEPPPEP